MGDVDIDATLAGIESPSSDGIPMHDPTPQPEPSAAQNQPVEEWEIPWNGRQIKAPREKVTQWASQGYDYAQKMAAFKSEQDAWQTKRQQEEQGFSKYREVDEYVKSNPQWWEHVEKSWEQRERMLNPDPSDPIATELKSMREELADLRNFKAEYVNEKTTKERQEQDRALNEEVQGTQKAYPQLDWTAVDESGLTLEARILQHAQQNGIGTFRAAFRDYYHDHLLTLSQSSRKEEDLRNSQQARKNGLLGTSPTPKKGVSKADNVKGKSYNSLLEEAKAELGLS